MKLRSWLSLSGIALTSVLLWSEPSACFGASSWTGNTDSLWTTAANWAGNTLPPVGTDIIFTDTINQTVDLGANQTIGSLTFIAADTYTLNNFTLTLGGNFSQFLGGAVTINSGLNTGGSARQFSNSGSGEVTIAGILSGAGAITFAGGNFTLGNAANTNTGGINVNAGLVTLNAPAGLALNSAAGVSQVGTGAININGGQLRLLPGTGTVGDIGRIVGFGTSGGTLNYAGNPGNGVALSLNATSASGTPATVLNGTANVGAGGAGWSSGASSINLNSLTGGGTARFQFTNSALLRFNAASTTNAVIFAGQPSGNVFVGATNTSVGRLLLPGGGTTTIGGGLTLQNFNQVTVDSGAHTLDANLTVNSGTTAFAGGGSSTDTSKTLSLGLANSSRTLTIQSGATAVLDLQNRADTAFQGGVVVNMPTVINAGGTLSVGRTMATNYNPAVTPTIGTITLNRNITGQGTAASESVLDLKLTGADIVGAQFASTANLVVNGSGTGGLRVQGTGAAVDSVLTTARLQGLTGSGGTLTMAYSDNSSRVITTAPTAPVSVRLGFDRVGSATPTFTLGATANSLNNWNGIVVKGGTVNVGALQSFQGALDVTGGRLSVDGANLTFGGAANVTGGTLSVASGRTLTVSQMTVGAAATVSGSGIIASSGLVPTSFGGTLSPGDVAGSAGTIRFNGGLTFASTAVLSFDLAAPGVVGGGVNDLIQVQNGALTLDGVLNVTALPGFGIGTYTLVSYGGTIVDSTVNFGTMPSGFQYSIAKPAGQVNLIVVPEPQTYALIALGLAGVWFARRGRRS